MESLTLENAALRLEKRHAIMAKSIYVIGGTFNCCQDGLFPFGVAGGGVIEFDGTVIIMDITSPLAMSIMRSTNIAQAARAAWFGRQGPRDIVFKTCSFVITSGDVVIDSINFDHVSQSKILKHRRGE
jgi:hypothetical protein